jgi:hypothetical protein
MRMERSGVAAAVCGQLQRGRRTRLFCGFRRAWKASAIRAEATCIAILPTLGGVTQSDVRCAADRRPAGRMRAEDSCSRRARRYRGPATRRRVPLGRVVMLAKCNGQADRARLGGGGRVWIAAMRGGGGVSTARLPRSGQARGVPWWGKMLQFCHGSRQSRHTPNRLWLRARAWVHGGGRVRSSLEPLRRRRARARVARIYLPLSRRA